MNETTIKNLRRIADHVERFELTGLACVNSVDTAEHLNVLLWMPQAKIPVFLAWVDTLGGPAVETTVAMHRETWHLNATGVLIDGTAIRVTVVIEGDERDGLDEELGNSTKGERVPIHRDVLAKLADPELLDDREEVSF